MTGARPHVHYWKRVWSVRDPEVEGPQTPVWFRRREVCTCGESRVKTWRIAQGKVRGKLA